MLHMEPPHQGIYAPLSQVMTDSDSEEEIHNSSKHRQQRLRQQQQQQFKLQHQQHFQEQHQQYKRQLRHDNRRTQSPPSTLPLTTSNIGNSLPAYPQKHLKIQRQRQRQLLQQQQEHLQRQQKFQLNNHQNFEGLSNGHHQPTSYTTNMQNTFRSVMMSDMGINGDGGHCDPVNSNFSSFNSDYDERNQIDADDIAILGNSNNKNIRNTPLSPARRCCFIISLLLCAMVVIGFVWLIPCREDTTCPAPIDRLKTRNWLNNYTKIELKAGVHIVTGVRNWENNLIFLYRGDAFFQGHKAGNLKPNGIISLVGSSGAVAWYDEMTDEPIAIDCTLIDVKRTGRSDCLILDEHGELGAINPITGQWHWHFKESSGRKVEPSDFPIILPDLDNDGVLEILLVTSMGLEQRTKDFVRKGEVKQQQDSSYDRNILRIISGRTGHQIGNGFKVHDCNILRKLQLENSYTITYNCLRNNTEAQRSKTLAELYALITNKSLMGLKLRAASGIAQHHYYGQRKDIDAQRNIYSLSGRELIVENRGKCPEDCEVTLILSEERNGKTIILRNFTNSGMYGMVPAQWHFKNTKSNLSGFVMKFWKWNLPNKNANSIKEKEKEKGKAKEISLNDPIHKTTFSAKKSKINSIRDNNIKANKAYNHHTMKMNKTSKMNKNRRRRRRNVAHEIQIDEFNIFNHLIHKRHAYTIPNDPQLMLRFTNSTRTANNLLINNYKMQMITESVILVLFIGAETRIENTSQSNIIQFCHNDNAERICQPDLNNQENSLLIADLDQDGSQELVSYMSTFVRDDDDDENNENWQLVTYVRLLRLQLELPAFFDDIVKRN